MTTTIPNFLFHRVHPERDALWDPMDPLLFERCISHITRHYEVALIEDAVLNTAKASNKPIATVSFDDGYQDNLEYAAPVLKKYSCPASFYVVTDSITTNSLTWTHFTDYVLSEGTHPLHLHFDFLTPEFQRLNATQKGQRIQFAKAMKPVMRNLRHDQRMQVLQRLRDVYADTELPKLMMNWDGVRQLQSEGHCIGSHTHTHAMLGTVDDIGVVEWELRESASVLKKELGRDPVSIAYPVGSYSPNVMDVAKAAGYKLALAVHQDVYNPGKDSTFAVPRIELYNEPWWKTRLRISNRLEGFKKIIGYR